MTDTAPNMPTQRERDEFFNDAIERRIVSRDEAQQLKQLPFALAQRLLASARPPASAESEVKFGAVVREPSPKPWKAPMPKPWPEGEPVPSADDVFNQPAARPAARPADAIDADEDETQDLPEEDASGDKPFSFNI